MFLSIKFLVNNEDIIFKLKKKIWPLIFFPLFCPLLILFAQFIIVPCFKSIFMNSISFESDTNYLFSILCFLLFIPMAVIIPLSYFLNNLVITNKRIYITQGVYGKLIIINIKDIIAYKHIKATSRGVASHFINFYLRNGSCIKTGNLYIKEKLVTDLIMTLNKTIGKEIKTRVEIKIIREYFKDNCEVFVKRNPFYAALSFTPFIIAIIMTILYISGVNNTGLQKDIFISGTVTKKIIKHDKYGKVSGYKLKVVDSLNGEKYNVPVDLNIYNMFSENNKLQIKAKKGSLGIVYDVWFYKE